MDKIDMSKEISGCLGMNDLDIINHPTHYTCRKHECIDEMIAVFGVADTIVFCKLNAWKYRYRADAKGTYEKDMAKADWYIGKAIELQNRLYGEEQYD